ncbi:MAG: KpsF/GutQ family sugar-phosphate isomerase [Lentimicrobiaceae bacterium]|nr:KpsF/GutQ family sugar-phosphate isomerase [Lentimicrobiaceae bacterium]MCP4911287.1 KpsF/GutQ family sugar-phosphate isomerase [Bacteroidota bacterium]MBT3454018.1 KpsF/GutQ family sugar-phosphate isomerase [Lentimicrobiaceae bacterium]MBT3819136.1 KpsF/GutQ family sugar-phosphate isomerase [Lentimicrobiaceae bacterium]MBT4060564.1 KpsF/GutQ family sugar-phosphate isomerase [Lentimicrobiaceae bacterium]
MSTNSKIKETAISVIKDEYQAIINLADSINDDFVESANVIYKSKGRVIVTGIGKSAIIAQKIVATFNSTGTPSIFMHAADAIHGDLGIVRPDDVLIIISKSGETPEIKVLVPLLKARKNKIIALVGNITSYLAQHSDLILNTTVDREACPNNLAPTTSTTAQLVMGDALAVCLLKLRGFSATDFANYHPGGSLGKKMYMRVHDLSSKNDAPAVDINESITNVIIEISSKRLGTTAVIDDGKMIGVITDGDLRRMIENHDDYKHLTAKDIMTKEPLSIEKDSLIVNALSLMRENNITQLPVMDGDNYSGVIHLHDILKEGIF